MVIYVFIPLKKIKKEMKGNNEHIMERHFNCVKVFHIRDSAMAGPEIRIGHIFI